MLKQYLRRAVGLLCGVLLLAGCGRAENASLSPAEIKERLTADCSFTAEFTYDTVEGCATVEKAGEVFSIMLTEPEVLTGLAFVLSPEGSQMIYGDTVIDLHDHTIHEEALAAVLERAFAGTDELTVTRQNGNILATADCTFFHYTVTLAEETGYPTAVSVPELSIEILISDYAPAGGAL